MTQTDQWRQTPDGIWWFAGADGHWHPSTTSPSSPTSTARPAQSWSTTEAGAWAAIAGGVLMAVSAFLPWVTAHALFVSIDRNAFQLGNQDGFSADGPVLLGLAVLTILVGITRLLGTSMPRYLQRSSIVTGIGAGVVVINRAPSIHDQTQHLNRLGDGLVSASIGYGLWVAAVAGVIAVVGGLILRSNHGPQSVQTVNPPQQPRNGRVVENGAFVTAEAKRSSLPQRGWEPWDKRPFRPPQL